MKKLLIFLLLLCFYSCKDTERKDDVSIVDDLGYEFTFERTPVKVISLAPSLTESIYYLEADTNLIGVTSYCDYPERAKTKTNIGGMLDPNLEIITRLNPDLIFLTTEGNSQITYKSLKDLGFKVFVLNPKNIEGIESTLSKLNSIFRSKNGTERLNNFKKEIRAINSKNKEREYAGFLSLKPLITFNKNTFLNDVFSKSGFNNIYANGKLDYPSISDEDLIVRDPEYLFVFSNNNEESMNILKDEIKMKFGQLKSVKNNNYYILDESLFTRPGPRIAKALKQLESIK